MNTAQINLALQNYKNFIGVFPSDLLPNIHEYNNNFPLCFIANYDTSKKKEVTGFLFL